MQQLTVFTAVLLAVITASLQHVPRPAQPLSFDYPSFSSNPPNITFQGDASAGGGVIDLTPIRQRPQLLTGRAVYGNPFRLWEYTTTGAGDGDRVLADFTTRFSFAVRPVPGNENVTGDGLAFFLAPYGSGIPRNGNITASGGYLGVFNATNTPSQPGFIPAVAVEYDTYRNQWDPDYVHVGIDVQTIESVVSARWPEIDPRVGATVDATISYDAGATTLSVFFQGNGTQRNLSHVVDLSKVLPDRVYVGFSAATGSRFEYHQILSWSFNSSLVVPSNRTSTSTVPNETKNKKVINVGVLVGVLAGVGALATGVLAVLAWRRRRWSRSGRGRRSGGAAREAEGGALDMVIDDGELIEGAGRGPRKFAYSELVRATDNFAAEARLGRGGFGDVYRGMLIMSDNNIPPIRWSSPTMEVAVKRVAKDSRQGKKEYVSEVRIISRLRHRNLVQLVGWCHEIQGELLLVYEYMPNGSLDTHLYGAAAAAPLLPWPTRYGIAQGVAAALLYLHEEWEQCVVHRDVKPSNVMLDGNFNANHARRQLQRQARRLRPRPARRPRPGTADHGARRDDGVSGAGVRHHRQGQQGVGRVQLRGGGSGDRLREEAHRTHGRGGESGAGELGVGSPREACRAGCGRPQADQLGGVVGRRDADGAADGGGPVVRPPGLPAEAVDEAGGRRSQFRDAAAGSADPDASTHLRRAAGSAGSYVAAVVDVQVLLLHLHGHRGVRNGRFHSVDVVRWLRRLRRD